MNASNIIYLFFSFSIIFLIIQPKITERFNLKKKYRNLHDIITGELSTKILEVDKYNFYKGKTKIIVDNYYIDLIEFQSKLEFYIKTPFTNDSLKEKIEELKNIMSRIKSSSYAFNDLKYKENQVFEYISKLKYSIIEIDNEKVQKQICFLEKTVESDIIQAFEYTLLQDDNSHSRIKRIKF